MFSIHNWKLNIEIFNYYFWLVSFFLQVCLFLFHVFWISLILSKLKYVGASWIHIIFFVKIWNFSAIISSNILSAPFSSLLWDLITRVMVYFTVSRRSLTFCLLFFILFSSCSSDWIILIDLLLSSLVLSSANSNILSGVSSDPKLIILFNSRMSSWFFYISIYIYIFHFLSLYYNETMFSYFPLILTHPLNHWWILRPISLVLSCHVWGRAKSHLGRTLFSLSSTLFLKPKRVT